MLSAVQNRYKRSSTEYPSLNPSLNDSLETGPPLQNLLLGVLVWNRLKPVVLGGDIKQAFLLVQI